MFSGCIWNFFSWITKSEKNVCSYFLFSEGINTKKEKEKDYIMSYHFLKKTTVEVQSTQKPMMG